MGEIKYNYALKEDGTAVLLGIASPVHDIDPVLSIPSLFDGHPVTEIGDSAFTRLSRIKRAEIPEGVRIIGRCAFRQCRSLEEVSLPESLETIGGYAFEQCRKLNAVVIPPNVKTIGKHVANALREELAGAESRTVANFATVQIEGGREVVRQVIERQA